MTAYYDNVAQQFKKIQTLPHVRHVEVYTYFQIMGDLTGKSVLDLGCGQGFYPRQIKQRGAAKVVGVDTSEKMIELARMEETREPLGIEYIVHDVVELGEIGRFDLVVASYFLNCARTREQLLKMCQSIYANLKEGSRFVSINGNLEQLPEYYPKWEKYGFTKSIVGFLEEGKPITLTFTVPNEDQKISFDNYYLNKATYEWAFHQVGFQEVSWQPLRVSPQGIQEFGQEYWQDLLDYPSLIGIECLK